LIYQEKHLSIYIDQKPDTTRHSFFITRLFYGIKRISEGGKVLPVSSFTGTVCNFHKNEVFAVIGNIYPPPVAVPGAVSTGFFMDSRPRYYLNF
jgi:hypothetical protein